ncbi:YbjE [Peptoclostridium acidaminophilum DSM 3953]|uniref:YbjE n=1 Tax=Peptoclostridium acidaminophilum DSM 3953 TaxID=1286171 RepID=W8U7W4_PEPAC|nr:lysine exporter LysO family protein [Peptoclostridium acidaminophilum]AHM56976.1 YbjE [Peptoclostridium acidaminophilum DSM 3953]
MSFAIIAAILAGVVSGMFIMPESFLQNTDLLATVSLNALLLLIGIEVGSNRNVMSDIKKSGLASLVVPVSIITGSLIGGLVAGLIFGLPHNISLSIASGFGWYSLSGIMLTKLANAQVGTIAFMTNVFREIFAVISIPYIAKYLNHYSAIAPAGATSMDTTLPLISKATSPSVVVVSFINGVLLSSLVPFFVTFFFSI